MNYGRIIKVDGQDLYDLGFVALFPYEDGPTYTFSANTVQIPNRAGMYKFRDVIETREIVIDFQFRANTNTDIDRKLEELNSLFFDTFGQRKKVKIELRHWRDKHTYAYLKEVVEIKRNNFKSVVRVELISYDPFKYSNEIITLPGQYGGDIVNWGSTTVTFNDPYTFAYQSIVNAEPLEIEINNLGLVTYPEVIITGRADSLTISANGQSIRVPSFNTEAKISRYISYLDGKEAFVKANKFYLKPGKNNITVTGTNANITIEFRIRETFK